MSDSQAGSACRSAEGAKAWLKRHADLVSVLLVALLAFLGRAWEGDLHGDPVHYAALAKNILATGDWLTLRDAPDLIYANKPPLMIWLVAGNFRVFGAGTFAAKFWSCLFAVGICALVFLTGRRLFGPTAGLLAGCAVAATPGMIANSLDLRLDSAVSLAVTATVYAVVRAVQDERPRWLLLAGVAGGLGFMTKMSAGAHVPAILALALAASRPRWLLHPFFWGALVLGAAIAAPWHLAVAARHGGEFTGTYFGREMGQRLVLGSHLATNLAANVPALLVYTLPWCLLAAYALFRWRRAGTAERWGLLLAVLWIAEVLAVTTVPPRRYDRYMTTAFPAVGLLAGCGLAWLIPERLRERVPRAIRAVAIVAAFLFALYPAPLHHCQSTGFVEARSLLDRLEPGPTLAGYIPASSAEGDHAGMGPWSLRAKATYYLDRSMRFYASADEMGRTPTRFVATRERLAADLAPFGFELVLRLDESYCLLMRRAPAGRPVKVP